MKINRPTSLPLDKFIEFALYDKDSGYYMKKNPFGKDGDFITAPNITRLFSEIIAIWVVTFWKSIGSPKKFNLLEKVKKFNLLKLKKSLSANKLIGVQEINAYLKGSISLDQCKELINIKTRQYAKRQNTWARGHMKNWIKLYSKDFSVLLKKTLKVVS